MSQDTNRLLMELEHAIRAINHQVINPQIVEGQVHGGLTQGIGQAMLEGVVYDASGQLLTGSYMDYTMPRADDVDTADCAYRSQSSARKGRWNHMAWSTLAICMPGVSQSRPNGSSVVSSRVMSLA